jgi:hypothetical protein
MNGFKIVAFPFILTWLQSVFLIPLFQDKYHGNLRCSSRCPSNISPFSTVPEVADLVSKTGILSSKPTLQRSKKYKWQSSWCMPLSSVYYLISSKVVNNVRYSTERCCSSMSMLLEKRLIDLLIRLKETNYQYIRIYTACQYFVL